MKKVFLFLLCLFCLNSMMQAALVDRDIDYSGFTSNYGNTSYTFSGNTITFTNAWGGVKLDCSALEAKSYSELHLVLAEATTQKVRLEATLTDDSKLSADIAVGSTEAVISLPKAALQTIRVYNWSNTATEVVIKIGQLYLSEHTGEMVEQTLFEGAQEHGNWVWDNNLSVAASEMTKVHEDAMLAFNYTQNTQYPQESESPTATFTYWQYKFCDGTGAVLTSNAGSLSSYSTLVLSSGSSCYQMRLNAADAMALETNGLQLRGYGVTTNKVVLVYWKQPKVTLWEGTMTTESWTGNQTINSSLFGKYEAKAKDKVVVTVSALTAGGQIFLQYVDAAWQWHAFEPTVNHVFAADDEAGEYAFELTQDMLDSILAGQQLAFGGVNYTATKIALHRYVAPTTKEVCVDDVLGEGSVTPAWNKHWEQPAGVINALQAGDVLTATVSSKGSSAWPQLYMAWGGTSETRQVFQASSITEFPHDFAMTLTEEQVTAIKAAGKLYISGNDVTVTKWTWHHCMTVSSERGNAATAIWTGEQVINWSNGGYVAIAKENLATARAGMRIRVNYKGLKAGAQGQLNSQSAGWPKLTDVTTIGNMATACGNYYEYTITDAMLADMQANGIAVCGIGFTATSVELIDPMKELVVRTSFDQSDIRAWEAGETPNMTVTLKNYEDEAVTVPVSISLMTDMWADYGTPIVQNVALAAGEQKTVDVNIAGLVLGFYRMVANANGNNLCTYYIGYNPTAIVSPYDAQSDFDAFWTTKKAELATVALNMSRTQHSDATNYIVYKYSVNSVADPDEQSPKTLQHYVKVPKSAGKHPVLVRFQGTDGGTSTLGEPSWAAGDEWVEVIVSTRGQMLNRDAKYGYDFYSYGLGSNDNHYYRMAYLDCVRAIDMVKAMPEADTQNIFLAGGSQGGCFTYVTAGLCGNDIRAIAPSITGHADFVHTMEIVTWPTNKFNDWINAQVEAGTYADYAAGKAALLQHQSYFDTKNFAHLITAKVKTNFSLQDQTDGPHLNIAPYNLLAEGCKAGYSINPFNGHAAASDWTQTYMAFFESELVSSTVSYDLSVSDAGMATLVLPFSVPELPAGVKAYTLTSDGSDEIQAAEVTAMQADKPILVVAAEGDYTFVSAAGESGDISGKTGTYTNGALVGVYAAGYVPNASSPYNYVLQNGSEGVGFYRVNSNDIAIAAYRAYLSSSYVAASGSAPMRIVFGPQTATGLEQNEAVEVKKMVLGGQVVIVRNGAYYNMQGQIIR